MKKKLILISIAVLTVLSVALIANIEYFPQNKANAQDLSPQMLADGYLLTAQKAYEAKDNQKAYEYFKKIEDLNIAVPNEFYYYYAKTLYNVGFYKKAGRLITIYIQKTGSNSKYYNQSLMLLNDSEDKLKSLKDEIVKSVKDFSGSAVQTGLKSSDGTYDKNYSVNIKSTVNLQNDGILITQIDSESYYDEWSDGSQSKDKNSEYTFKNFISFNNPPMNIYVRHKSSKGFVPVLYRPPNLDEDGFILFKNKDEAEKFIDLVQKLY